jgi:hypothetical protein
MPTASTVATCSPHSTRAAQQAGVTVITNTCIEGIQQTSNTVTLTSNQQPFGPFDLVIAADGNRSTIRSLLTIKKRETHYAHGALWYIGTLHAIEKKTLPGSARPQPSHGATAHGPRPMQFLLGTDRTSLPEMARERPTCLEAGDGGSLPIPVKGCWLRSRIGKICVSPPGSMFVFSNTIRDESY